MTSAGGQRVNRIQDLAGHSGRINCLRFGPGGNPLLVATGGNDRKVLIWKLKSKNPLLVLSGLANAVEGLAFQPAGELVAAGSSSGTVKLWDLAEGKVARTLTGHKQSTVALHFHASSQIIATGALDSTAKVWDLRQRECTHTLRVDSAGVTALHFSPDSRWLATGEQDGTLQLWDVFSGKRMGDLSHRAHEDQVTSIAFHPGELLLASGSADRTCKLWDLEANDFVTSFEQEGKALRCVKFSRDGRALLTSHPDAVRVWGWEPTRCFDTVSLSTATVLPSKLPAQPLSAAADLCLVGDQWQLMGGSLGHSTASIWSINLQHVEPFRKNEVEEREDVGAPMQEQQQQQQQQHDAGGEPAAARVADADDSTESQTSAEDTVLADVPDTAGRESAQSREPCPQSREAVPDSLPDKAKHPARALFADAPAVDRETRETQAEPARQRRATEGRHETPGDARRGKAGAAGTAAFGTRAKPPSPAKPRESAGPRFLAPTASWRLRSQAAAADAASPAHATEPADPGAPAGSRPGALFDLSPNKKAGRRNTRRSLCVPDEGATPQPGRRSSPMRLRRLTSQTGDENKTAFGGEAAARTGPAKGPLARTSSVTASSHARKPWSPSIVVKQAAKGATPDKPSRNPGLRPSVAGTLGVGRPAMGTPSQAGRSELTPTSGQPNLSVLGHTSWVVPLKGPPAHTPEAPSQLAGAKGPSRHAVAPPSASTVPLGPSLASSSEGSCGGTAYGSSLSDDLSGALSSSGGVSVGSQGSVHSSLDAPPLQLNASTSGSTPSRLMRSLLFSEQSPALQSRSHDQASPAPSPVFPTRSSAVPLKPSPLGATPKPSPYAVAGGPVTPPALTLPTAHCGATPGGEGSGPGVLWLPPQHPAGLQASQAGVSRDTPGAGRTPLDAGKASTPLVPKWEEGQGQPPAAPGTPFTPDGAFPSAATGTLWEVPEFSGEARHLGPAVGASPATPAGLHWEQGQEGRGAEEGAVVSVRTHGSFSSLQKGAPPAQAQVARPAATPSSFAQFLHASRSTGAGAFDQAALHQPSPVTGLSLASSAVGQEIGGGDSSACDAEEVSGRASLQADALLQHLSFRHTEVMALLAMRRRQLQEAKLLWAGGEGAETMRLLAKWKDPHVLVAVLGAMVTNGDETTQPFSTTNRGKGRGVPAASSQADNRWLCIGLAGCAPLLALLKDLLSAPYPFYVETCVRALADVLRCHGQVLHDMRNVPVGTGVDLHRDARRLLCEQCLTSLRAMRDPLESLASTPSDPTSTGACSVLRSIDAVFSK